MQVIYHWAFAVTPAPCAPRTPSTLKSGWARAPPGYMAPAPLLSNIRDNFQMCNFLAEA